MNLLSIALTHSLTVAIPPGGGIGGAAHNRSVSIPPAFPAVVCTQKIGTVVPQLVPIPISTPCATMIYI